MRESLVAGLPVFLLPLAAVRVLVILARRVDHVLRHLLVERYFYVLTKSRRVFVAS